MSDTARLLGVMFIAVAFLALGWFGRGKWDGLDVSKGESANQSQAFVTSGAEATTKINTAQTEADQANERVRERIKVQYVDRTCPPGAGAVSGPVTGRLQSAFSKAGSTGG